MRNRNNPLLWLALPALLGLLSVPASAQDDSKEKDSSSSNTDLLGPDPFGFKKKNYEEGQKDVGGLWNKGTVDSAVQENWKKDTSLTLEAPKLNLNNLSNPNGGAPSLLDKNNPLFKPLGPQGTEGWTGVGVDVKTAALMGKYSDWSPTPGREGFCSDSAQLCVPADPKMMEKYDKSVLESIAGKAGADPKAGPDAGKPMDPGAINAANAAAGGPLGKTAEDFKSYNDCIDAGVCFGPKAPEDPGGACPGPGGVPCSLKGIAENGPKAESCDPAFCVEAPPGALDDLDPGIKNSDEELDKILNKGNDERGFGINSTPREDDGPVRNADYDVEGGGGGVGAQSFDGGGDSSLKPREKSYNQMTQEEKDAYRKSLLALRESVYDPSDPGPSGKRIWQVREEA
ncbi:MAG: hypothetical protein AAB339_05350, partial [Elusimicrobiota bacterium]